MNPKKFKRYISCVDRAIQQANDLVKKLSTLKSEQDKIAYLTGYLTAMLEREKIK